MMTYSKIKIGVIFALTKMIVAATKNLNLLRRKKGATSEAKKWPKKGWYHMG